MSLFQGGLCLLSALTPAGAEGLSVESQAGSSTVTVTAREVKPGYYLCAVWRGDELLTLFEAPVGSDGVLYQQVDVGTTLGASDKLTVGVSGANAGAAPLKSEVVVTGTGTPGGTEQPGGSAGTGGNGSSGGTSAPDSAPGQPETPEQPPQPDGAPDLSPDAPPPDFQDVKPGVYYYDAVGWAVLNGITNGTGGGTFSPDRTCTRAEIVTFLWRAAGSPAPAQGVNPFRDVYPGTFYYDAVLWAVEEGITTGVSPDAFDPDGVCTRGQAVALLYRASGSPAKGVDTGFTDVAPEAYYAGAVVWAVENGVTLGTGGGRFSPDTDCTRGQIVTFLYRVSH